MSWLFPSYKEKVSKLEKQKAYEGERYKEEATLAKLESNIHSIHGARPSVQKRAERRHKFFSAVSALGQKAATNISYNTAKESKGSRGGSMMMPGTDWGGFGNGGGRRGKQPKMPSVQW